MRYAIYFTPPPDAQLTDLAARWLGRDAFSGMDRAALPVDGMADAVMGQMVSDPRRYGFHATLKAPFRLAGFATEASLISAFDSFCASRPAFEIPEIVLHRIDGFFALAPRDPCPALNALADDAVRAFEPFRAPLSEADIARRRPERLSTSERDNLLTWGYPHVFADFQFHMTLTGRIGEAQVGAVRDILTQRFTPVLRRPLEIAGLGLFVEPAQGADFTVLAYRQFRPSVSSPLTQSGQPPR